MLIQFAISIYDLALVRIDTLSISTDVDVRFILIQESFNTEYNPEAVCGSPMHFQHILLQDIHITLYHVSDSIGFS
jgi:hypothetical protein